MPQDLQQLAEDTFYSHMSSYLKVEMEKENGGLRIAKMDAFFSIRIENVSPYGSEFAAFVFADVQFGMGQTIHELMMGAGNSAAEAIVFAVHDLVESVLAPVVMLCFASLNAPGTSSLMVSDGDCEWVVIQGPVLNNDYSGKLSEFFKQKTPFEMVLEKLNVPLIKEQLHWVKVYWAEVGGHTECEVRVDNEVIEGMAQRLCDITLPKISPMMFRQFAVLAPQEWVSPD